MKMLTNYKPLLRLDGEISVRPLQIETVVSEKGFVSTLWARRAKDSLVVDWGQEKVFKGNVDNSRVVGGPTPEYLQPGAFLIGGNGKLGFTRNGDGFKIDWKRNSSVFPLVVED